MNTVSEMPMTTLENGLTIANFSSPHAFVFECGGSIGRCDSDRVEAGKLTAIEAIKTQNINGIEVENVNLEFSINPTILGMLEDANGSSADIVLVPFPVMNAIKYAEMPIGKFRVCRVKDRETKELFNSKFCI